MGHRKRATKAELSRILGVSHTSLSKFQHEPSFPDFDREDKAEIYAVCVWWYLRKEANPVPTDDGLMVGAESDGLERYRQARAGQEEIKLAESQRKVVKLDDFEETSTVVLSPYRRVGEFFKRAGNADHWQMIEEANREVEKGLERLYGCDDITSEDPLD